MSLKITDLRFCYDGMVVIDDFSIELALGKIYAVVAPSGAGKSTFASLIAGHLRPNHGEIVLDGSQVTRPGRDIFVVHQEDDLFPWLNVRKQLEFVSKDDCEIERLLKLVNLYDCQYLYPRELSGGMKKRLALIRAELVQAKIIILDEVFSSLDVNLTKEILSELMPCWKNKNQTVIIITHQLELFNEYVDKVVEF